MRTFFAPRGSIADLVPAGFALIVDRLLDARLSVSPTSTTPTAIDSNRLGRRPDMATAGEAEGHG
jgi:hypothetical protein